MIKNGYPLFAGLSALLVALLGASGAAAQPPRESVPVDAPAPPAPTPAEQEPPSDAGFDLASLQTPGGLTADAAAARARETAPSLVRSRATVGAAQANADRAWLGVLPRLEVSARYTRLSNVDQASLGVGDASAFDMTDMLVAGVDDLEAQFLFDIFVDAFRGFSSFEFPVILNQYAFRASLTYPVSDVFLTILPAYRATEAFADAERVRSQADQATIELRAREAFYGYARARGALAVAQSTVAQIEAQRRQVEALVNAGVAARVDLMRVDALLASARVAEAQTNGAVAVAAHAVRTLIHEDGEGDLPIGEDLTAPLSSLGGSRQDHVARALEHRAEMRALRQLVRARGHVVSARSASRLPHLAVAANVDIANPNQRVFPQQEEFGTTWDVSAILSWSPNDLLAGNADVRAAEAEVAQTRADMEALSDAVRMEVTQAWEGNRSAESALEAASVGIEAAEESYRVRQNQLDAGTAVTSDLIDSETELSRARLQLLNALIDLRVARARLVRAVGG